MGRREVIPPERRALTHLTLKLQIPGMSLNYEIRVRGRVGDHLADALGLAAEIEPVETVLRGPVGDQEGLHGILDRLQEMGLELVEVRRLPAPD
jgi:hypothetical protein